MNVTGPTGTIPGTQGATGTTAAGSLTGGNSALGQEEFLQLLVAQLGNQDPMNPMDGQQFAAQLAQFSSVERLLNIETALESAADMNGLLAQSVNSGVAAGMIGRDVEAYGNQVAWDGDGDAALAYDLAANASEVTVTIRDQNGNVVRELTPGAQEDGRSTLAWDGTDKNGATVPEGVYTFEVAAVDANDEAVAAETYVTGTVDRIRFSPDGTQLWIGPMSVWMGDVLTVQSA